MEVQDSISKNLGFDDFSKDELFELFKCYKADAFTLVRKAVELGLIIEIVAYNHGSVQFTVRNINMKPGWRKSITIWPDSQTYEEVLYKED